MTEGFGRVRMGKLSVNAFERRPAMLRMPQHPVAERHAMVMIALFALLTFLLSFLLVRPAH